MICLGSLFIVRQRAAPQLFHEAALVKILNESIVEDFARFAANHRALFTGVFDGFRDHFAWHDHAPVDQPFGVGIVGRLQGIGVAYA